MVLSTPATGLLLKLTVKQERLRWRLLRLHLLSLPRSSLLKLPSPKKKLPGGSVPKNYTAPAQMLIWQPSKTVDRSLCHLSLLAKCTLTRGLYTSHGRVFTLQGWQTLVTYIAPSVSDWGLTLVKVATKSHAALARDSGEGTPSPDKLRQKRRKTLPFTLQLKPHGEETCVFCHICSLCMHENNNGVLFSKAIMTV